MAEKMTIENMSNEMDVLWGRIKELEMTLSEKIDTKLKRTASKIKHRLQGGSTRRLGDLVISDELRNELIQLTAYYKAERSGFIQGEEEKNWMEAEEEVDYLLLQGSMDTAEASTTTSNAEAAPAKKPGSKKTTTARKSVSKQ